MRAEDALSALQSAGFRVSSVDHQVPKLHAELAARVLHDASKLGFQGLVPQNPPLVPTEGPGSPPFLEVSAQELLSRTPYLIPTDVDSVRRFRRAQQDSISIQIDALRAQAAIAKKARSILDPFIAQLRAEMVAESNRIEGYEWSRAQVLSAVAAYRELVDMPLGQFVNGIRHDERVYEALGLYRAHQLAEDWARQRTRPREFELRQLHSLIAAGERFAGRYKDRPNSIGGSAHQTTPPLDVARAMEELVAWWTTSGGDPILDATVVHAWLTHIHPFEDGNGRMARLLANMTLIQSSYPPMILSAQSDKGQYYEALNESDNGDILPLYALFAQVTRKTVRIMSRPDYVSDVINERLLASVELRRRLWSLRLRDFRMALEEAIRRYGWRVQWDGEPDAGSFALLLERDQGGNSWFLRLFDQMNRAQWLLWFGYTTDSALDYTKRRRTQVPSIFISRRTTDQHEVVPYRWVRDHRELPDEIILLPASDSPLTFADALATKEMDLESGAEALAKAFVDNAPIQ